MYSIIGVGIAVPFNMGLSSTSNKERQFYFVLIILTKGFLDLCFLTILSKLHNVIDDNGLYVLFHKTIKRERT
jgi:hypothetical protein